MEVGITMSEFIDNNMKNYIGPEPSWKILKDKIDKKIPICYVRFNEGESRVVANIPGRLRKVKPGQHKMKEKGKCSITKYGPGYKRKWGRWSYNQNEDKSFHSMMLEALVEPGENYYASLCDNKGYSNYRYQTLVLMQDHMKDHTPSVIISAHAPHNKKVHDSLFECFSEHKNNINVICNEKGDISKLPFTPKKVWRVSNEEAHKKDIGVIDEINKYILDNNIKNEIFLGCAGPFTNILLHRIWKENPTNHYLDIGSTLDYYLFSQPTRGWLNKMGYPAKKRDSNLR